MALTTLIFVQIACVLCTSLFFCVFVEGINRNSKLLIAISIIMVSASVSLANSYFIFYILKLGERL